MSCDQNEDRSNPRQPDIPDDLMDEIEYGRNDQVKREDVNEEDRRLY